MHGLMLLNKRNKCTHLFSQLFHIQISDSFCDTYKKCTNSCRRGGANNVVFINLGQTGRRAGRRRDTGRYREVPPLKKIITTHGSDMLRHIPLPKNNQFSYLNSQLSNCQKVSVVWKVPGDIICYYRHQPRKQREDFQIIATTQLNSKLGRPYFTMQNHKPSFCFCARALHQIL